MESPITNSIKLRRRKLVWKSERVLTTKKLSSLIITQDVNKYLEVELRTHVIHKFITHHLACPSRGELRMRLGRGRKTRSGAARREIIAVNLLCRTWDGICMSQLKVSRSWYPTRNGRGRDWDLMTEIQQLPVVPVLGSITIPCTSNCGPGVFFHRYRGNDNNWQGCT